ncbi:MAG: hypothetical protein LBD58_08590 [Treponema sp.]|jgi:hypothetical protein|nr:hypothetical protein [Treponema sp.]
MLNVVCYSETIKARALRFNAGAGDQDFARRMFQSVYATKESGVSPGRIAATKRARS